MNNSQQTKWSGPWRIIVLGFVILAAGIAVTAFALYGPHQIPVFAPRSAGTPPDRDRPAIELAEDIPHTLKVPERVQKAMGIAHSEEAKPPSQARPMLMPGSTALDPSRVYRIKTRFNAEVVEIAQVPDETRRSVSTETVTRELRPGDRVRKGEVLAVVWSTDVGGRKSDLVDALVQLRLDEKRLQAREELYRKGSLPEDLLLQTRHDVVSGRNAKERAERTLRTWNIPEHEIQAVYDEAELAAAREGKRDTAKERLWARSELVAPRSGTLVERNVSVGEYVADNTINLFTIAEVDRLLVLANPPEDQLPALLGLKPEEMRWSLQTAGASVLDGPIEEVGYLIDANQHTAVVKGYIDNPEGKLRAGQFVAATVNLPAPPGVVEVPLTALIEDGRQSFLFVQPFPGKPLFTMRRVQVTHRFEHTAFVRSNISPLEQKLSPGEEKMGFQTLQPLTRGELFIPSGVLELRNAPEDKESMADRKP
jgi:cobalt-zinc-cadmium efflux system membrane fusion protein